MFYSMIIRIFPMNHYSIFQSLGVVYRRVAWVSSATQRIKFCLSYGGRDGRIKYTLVAARQRFGVVVTAVNTEVRVLQEQPGVSVC